MANDVLLNKAATVERCVARAREEFFADPEGFAQNYTRQDAAILNIQRACEAVIDMGQQVIRQRGLGLPQSSRDVFALLASANLITLDLAEAMKKMIGFRNIAVHDYKSVQLAITENVIENHMDEFLMFSALILQLPE